MKKAFAGRCRRDAAGRRHADRADDQINGAGATFPNPIYSKWFSEYNKLHPNVADQLSVDRIRRRHPADHEGDGLLRRQRRPDDRRAAQGRARADPALPDGARRRRAGLQHRRREHRAEVHRPGAGGHLSRQDHEVERRGDREAEPGRQAAGDRHHGRASLGRLRHDLHLGRLPVEDVAGIQEQGRREDVGQLADGRRRQGERGRVRPRDRRRRAPSATSS